MESDPTNEKLYIQLLDIEYQKYPVNVISALSIFTKAIDNPSLSLHTKIKMSQRRLEFLEDFGSSILQLKECYDDHQKLLKDLQSEKKRKSTETPPEEPAEKKMKANSVATSGTGGAGGGGDQLSADYAAYWAQYQNAASGYCYNQWGGYPAQPYYNSQ